MDHPPRKSPFLEEVRNAIRVRHYNIRTEEAYVGWIKRFILFHNKRHPKEMGETEGAAFLSHLAVEESGVFGVGVNFFCLQELSSVLLGLPTFAALHSVSGSPRFHPQISGTRLHPFVRRLSHIS